MRLKDRIAIVTGAGSGIGKATALRFASEGAVVVCADVNEAAASATAGEIEKAGGKARAQKADIADPASAEALVKETLARHKRLDILINNAGINKDAAMKKMAKDQWDAVISVNLTGTYNVCRAAMMPMIEQNSGRIVNTASVAVLGNFGQANYAASKAGVIGLTRTMALELARHKVTVNAIAPGAVDTPMTAGIPPEVKEQLMKRIPLGRMARPEEIAGLHLFLASDEAAYITGQVIFVDGGLSVGA